ncbi:VOC family protein [Stieleria varia]|uniref:Metallothiol transferase FosB 2 n=1 Tax=Stieleria varia TaxID=2528005 RepID=A0A5C6B840_9BACT|nr:VOC family protein [Stieleria varia]TWU07459.1 Metallothiol transferase FosB 2 [Stieleria varia]
MQQRISLITLGVRDLAVSKRFYTEILGWEPVESPPEVVFFDLGGLVFSLYPHESLAADFNTTAPTDQPTYRGFTLAHNLRSEAEVNALFEHLKKHDVVILKEPEKVFWGGYSGYFTDPDGHCWEIAHNPFWTIKDDGRIEMQPPDVDE